MTFEQCLQEVSSRSGQLYNIDFVDYFKGHPFRREWEEGRTVEEMTARLTKWIPYWE